MYQYQSLTAAFNLLTNLPLEKSIRATARMTRRNELNSEQLIKRVANGDTAALELLYEQYAPAVMGLAIKMLGDRASAEEVVQETFWRVWRNAETFSTRQGSFSGWLFGITRNLSIDTWRRGKVRPQPLINEAEQQQLEDNPDPEADVDESAWTAIKHVQVRQALYALPHAQRQVVEMAFFGGLTRQEIAETIGVPLGTVHTRARLGLQKLRELLQEQGFEMD
jgi:RNA polymerase sigma-70 factor (ECF subfamily)